MHGLPLTMGLLCGCGYWCCLSVWVWPCDRPTRPTASLPPALSTRPVRRRRTWPSALSDCPLSNQPCLAHARRWHCSFESQVPDSTTVPPYHRVRGRCGSWGCARYPPPSPPSIGRHTWHEHRETSPPQYVFTSCRRRAIDHLHGAPAPDLRPRRLFQRPRPRPLVSS